MVRRPALGCSSVTGEISEDDLLQIEARLEAALAIVPPPWLPLRETRDGIGGSSFIRGGHPKRDHEVYIELNLEGEIVRSPDERLDQVLEFLG